MKTNTTNRRAFVIALGTVASGLIAGSTSMATSDDIPGTHGGKPTKGKKAKHDCKGQNACKGQGGCKTGDNGCSGKNSCKGKGGVRGSGEKNVMSTSRLLTQP